MEDQRYWYESIFFNNVKTSGFILLLMKRADMFDRVIEPQISIQGHFKICHILLVLSSFSCCALPLAFYHLELLIFYTHCNLNRGKNTESVQKFSFIFLREKLAITKGMFIKFVTSFVI